MVHTSSVKFEPMRRPQSLAAAYIIVVPPTHVYALCSSLYHSALSTTFQHRRQLVCGRQLPSHMGIARPTVCKLTFSIYNDSRATANLIEHIATHLCNHWFHNLTSSCLASTKFHLTWSMMQTDYPEACKTAHPINHKWEHKHKPIFSKSRILLPHSWQSAKKSLHKKS